MTHGSLFKMCVLTLMSVCLVVASDVAAADTVPPLREDDMPANQHFKELPAELRNNSSSNTTC